MHLEPNRSQVLQSFSAFVERNIRCMELSRHEYLCRMFLGEDWDKVFAMDASNLPPLGIFNTVWIPEMQSSFRRSVTPPERRASIKTEMRPCSEPTQGTGTPLQDAKVTCNLDPNGSQSTCHEQCVSFRRSLMKDSPLNDADAKSPLLEHERIDQCSTRSMDSECMQNNH